MPFSEHAATSYLSSVSSPHPNLYGSLSSIGLCRAHHEVSGFSPHRKAQLLTWLVNSELIWYGVLTQANQTYSTHPTTDRNHYSNLWVPERTVYVPYTYFCHSTYSPFFSLFICLSPIKLTPEGWEPYLGHLWILSSLHRAWSTVGI